jgi:uncharacterized protein YdaU (DUF1376 family)
MRKKEDKPLWMPLYWADYFLDTRGLTRSQHGSYLLLIAEYWTKGRLPTDEKQLARIAMATEAQWKSERHIYASMFQPGWRHKRIDAELAEAHQYIASRQNNALKGWARRRSQGTVVPFPKDKDR